MSTENTTKSVVFTQPKVDVISYSTLNLDENGVPVIAKYMKLDPDATDMENLVEFAGRACYESFHKPNPDTRKNSNYIVATVEDKNHYSIAEHGVVNFYLTGVSRSLTHELVRHRDFGYSQLSQRFVDESHTRFVLPPLYWDKSEDEMDHEELSALADNLADSLIVYNKLVEAGVDSGANRKQAREAARAVLPNCVETKIVVTGSVRSLYHMLERRMAPDADAEIQYVARLMYKEMTKLFPSLFPELDN